MARDDAWARYQAWNDAVAAVVYPVLDEPVPVYLDLDDDVLAEIGRVAGYEGDPREGLRQAVLALVRPGDGFRLRPLGQRHLDWISAGPRSEQPPPTLAYLALTVLAAEDMGRADDGIGAGAYYPRLAALLGDSTRVREEYVVWAEPFWGWLNRWLERLEGRRGTPTAFALRHRFVGLPLSQALVRDGDRRRLPVFFAQYGLAPGMDLAPEVLERYLDAWFGSETCAASAPLRRMWGMSSARERIAAVAALELLGWDGSLPDSHRGETALLRRLGLMVQLRHGFMGSSLDVSLTLRATADEGMDGRMEVESVDGRWLDLTFAPMVANLWRTTYAESVDVRSVLEGVVKVRRAGEADADVLRRHPRSVVPLVLDELQSAFLEQERLQLNVDCVLLVRETVKGRPLADAVATVLGSCARPGFTLHREMPGLPAGWVLISDVQLFGAPTETRFNELVPLARDQLTVAGGMRIPSRIRKWSSVAPPELRAAVESTQELRVELVDLDQDEIIRCWTTEGGALVVPLISEGLGDGDFRAALFAGDSDSPLQQVTVRLRSADTPDPGWGLVPRLVYRLDAAVGPLGALSAGELDPDCRLDRFVDGAVTEGQSGVSAEVAAAAVPSWSARHSAVTARPPVQVGLPDPKSCVVTGAHYLEFPPYLGGHQPKYIDGECRYCGLVKRSPGWVRPAWRRSHSSVAAPAVDVSALPPVEVGSSGMWDAALDAIMHLGGGNAAQMSSVACQIDGSALFTSAFPRVLEALGHIAVERNLDGNVSRWEVSPSCLVMRGSGSWRLMGHWPPALITLLENHLEELGASIEVAPITEAPSLRSIEGAGDEPSSLAFFEGYAVVDNAGVNVLKVLPRLSEVAAALPRTGMPGATEAQRFDLQSASWVRAGDTSCPGAYRLRRGFETVDIFRTQDDVDAGQAARVSVYLAKHLAANAAGRSLAVYLEGQRVLAVPRGCDLPGLYARALQLGPGVPPDHGVLRVADERRRCLLYRDVDRDAADLLITLLTT